MADTTTVRKVIFASSHVPKLDSGDYKVEVEQSLEAAEIKGADNRPLSFQATSHFSVYGERFSLNPESVSSVFPPSGSLGEHSNVLPHIVLSRSTLPWERHAQQDSESGYWLALLVFYEGEIVKQSSMTLGDYIKPGARITADLDLETAQHKSDLLNVIDVKKSVLEKIVCQTLSEHQKLSHVRTRNTENAVVVSNRLPKPNSESTAHLVSVEGRYVGGKFQFGPDNGTDHTISLVSLKSWKFRCASKEHTFTGLLSALSKKNENPSNQSLRLPISKKPQVEKYLADGLLPMRHKRRWGQKSMSWYHGPLVPFDSARDQNQIDMAERALDARAADELLIYDSTSGMLDTSYAAAWELGRLLLLQSNKLSLSLYHWKRNHVHDLKRLEHLESHPHLPYSTQTLGSAASLPSDIEFWLSKLSLLEWIPFNYLVPDEAMLPAESIRFFKVDHEWMASLVAGAFSVGSVHRNDHKHDQHHRHKHSGLLKKTVSGFLLRSEVVSGWPGLQVDGYKTTGTGQSISQKLVILRKDKLTPNLLLVLFDGDLQQVDIHQVPEALHYGFDKVGEDNSAYSKKPGKIDGENAAAIPVPVKFSFPAQRTVDIDGLFKDLNANDISSFSAQMLEGVECVSFEIASN